MIQSGPAPTQTRLSRPLAASVAGWWRTAGGCAALGASIAAFFAFCGLDRPPLHAWDEAWYAKVALEMVRGGEWWIAYNDGVPDPWLLRPPLTLWALGALYRLLGPTELATRLFSAACFVLLVAVVAAFCRRHFSARMALTAAFLLAADRMLLFKHGARSGDTDAPLMLFVTLTMFAVWRLAHARTPWLIAWLGAAAFAAALLTKGVAALQIVPVIAAWLVLLAIRDGRHVGRAALRVALLLALAAVPFLAWLAIRDARQPGFAAAMVNQDLLSRVATHVDRAEPRRHSYVATILTTAWPVWLAIAATAAALRGRLVLNAALLRPQERRPLLWLLLIWWLLPIGLFALARTHRDWYIYPSYVPAAILCGWLLAAGAERLERRGRRWFAAGVGLLVLGGVGGPSLWKAIHYTRSDQERVAEMRQLLATLEAQPPARLILYRPDPALRFYLYRAGVEYAFVWEPERLAATRAAPAPTTAAAASHRRGVCILCSVYDRDEVMRNLPGGAPAPRLILDRLGVVLYES